jgi:hypothetical protein
MFLAPLPLNEALDAFIKSFSEISSSFWDSNVFEDEELESHKVLVDSLFETVNFFHLDLHLSGCKTIGTD